MSNWILWMCPVSIPKRWIVPQISVWAIRVVCGRGHQPIKRSQILMVLLLHWHTPLCLVWEAMQQWRFFSLTLTKQLRQCCSLGPYAVPSAVQSPPMYLSVGTWSRLKGLSEIRHLMHFGIQFFNYFFLCHCMTDTGALINSSQCDLAHQEKNKLDRIFSHLTITETAESRWRIHQKGLVKINNKKEVLTVFMFCNNCRIGYCSGLFITINQRRRQWNKSWFCPSYPTNCLSRCLHVSCTLSHPYFGHTSIPHHASGFLSSWHA